MTWQAVSTTIKLSMAKIRTQMCQTKNLVRQWVLQNKEALINQTIGLGHFFVITKVQILWWYKMIRPEDPLCHPTVLIRKAINHSTEQRLSSTRKHLKWARSKVLGAHLVFYLKRTMTWWVQRHRLSKMKMNQPSTTNSKLWNSCRKFKLRKKQKSQYQVGMLKIMLCR